MPNRLCGPAENRAKISSNARSESASSYSIDSRSVVFKGFEMPKPVPSNAPNLSPRRLQIGGSTPFFCYGVLLYCTAT
jgi:hypothetical protein